MGGGDFEFAKAQVNNKFLNAFRFDFEWNKMEFLLPKKILKGRKWNKDVEPRPERWDGRTG